MWTMRLALLGVLEVIDRVLPRELQFARAHARQLPAPRW